MTGTHLLAGLLQVGECVGVVALRGLGLDVDALREELREPEPEIWDPPTLESFLAAFGGGEQAEPTAEDEALLALGAEDGYYDTGHLLVALVRHGVPQLTITADEVRAEIRRRMAEFLSGRVPPIDPAKADALIGEPRVWVPDGIRELGRRIEALRRERDAAVHAEEYERGAAIREREKELIAARRRLVAAWSSKVDLLAVVEEVEALRAEVDRLRNR
ncbi:MAG: hypothetical protein M3422_13465 [Actinomycetota bacterium]|nr:hypothetical protein [Actinomycetota bacterium]